MWIKRALALAVIALLMLLLALAINGQPGLLQYAFLPPALVDANQGQTQAGEGNTTEQEGAQTPANQPADEQPTAIENFLKAWKDFLAEQKEAINAGILVAHLPDAAMQTETGGSAGGELRAVYGDLHTLPESLLLSGRRLYQEELAAGTPSAVLDEGLAIALFRQGEPIGLTFTFQGQTFTVVGVERHNRALGDRAPYGLTVPLTAFATQPNWELMTAQFRTTGGSGTRAGLSKALQTWQSKGQSIDLFKEKYRAMLPLRVLLCLLAAALAFSGIRLAGIISRRLLARNKAALEKQYAIRLLPRFALTGLGLALMYAGLVGILILAFTQLLAPVYVFPEWVPAILVEPKEIMKTFWDNRAMDSQLLALRSPEGITLSALGTYHSLLALLAGGLLIAPLHELRRKIREMDS